MTSADMKELLADPKVLDFLKQSLSALKKNASIDLSAPVLRPVFRGEGNEFALVLICVIYTALIVAGVLGNVAVGLALIIRIRRRSRRLKLNGGQNEDYDEALRTATAKDVLLLSVVIAFFAQLTIVVPLSLFNFFVQNWVLGELACYALPAIQDVPMYGVSLTLFFVCADRFRRFRLPTCDGFDDDSDEDDIRPKTPWAPARPQTRPMSVPAALISAWVVPVGVTLAYYSNIKHVDLSVSEIKK